MPVGKRQTITRTSKTTRIAVVGGGFTGAMTCIGLARSGPTPMTVRLYEPRSEIGAGIAYSTQDPDHRLNGPTDLIDMWGQDHFREWYAAHEADPDDRAADGYRYARRSVIARYVGEVLARHCSASQGCFRLDHIRRTVDRIERSGQRFRLRDDHGATTEADRVFLCTGHEPPRLPGPFAALAGAMGVVVDPWGPAALATLPRSCDVLVLGAGLTAYDMIVTLLRRGEHGRITALSRSGLRPQAQGRLDRLAPGFVPPLAPFSDRHSPPWTAARLMQFFRQDLAIVSARGLEWQLAFDNMRQSLPKIWPLLAAQDKRRLMRHVGGLYDTRRFRVARQTETIVTAAEARGQVIFRRGQVQAISGHSSAWDATFDSRVAGRFSVRFGGLINCTGPVQHVGASRSPLVRTLLDQGLARPDPSGIGFEVDDLATAIGAGGAPTVGLVILGVITNGRFGDMIAMPQIDGQIRRILDAMRAQNRRS